VSPIGNVATCVLLSSLALVGCDRKELPASAERHITVTATAFNSTRAQTDSRPTEAACGDTLANGAKVIAVSRDLVRAGLTCGTTVRIEGFDGDWKVVDRMAANRKKHIDIYMGRDIRAAREWGRQDVRISWRVGSDSARAKNLE
jgi:3D (Asp-Asp-Asp) domain-containing protein